LLLLLLLLPLLLLLLLLPFATALAGTTELAMGTCNGSNGLSDALHVHIGV